MLFVDRRRLLWLIFVLCRLFVVKLFVLFLRLLFKLLHLISRRIAFPTSSSGQLRDFGFAFDNSSDSIEARIPSSAPPHNVGGRDHFSFTAPVDRRRSLSFNSLSTTKANRPVSSAPKDPVRSAEDEKIRTELHRWKMELDGVIGAIGNKSPSASGTRSPRISKSPPREGTRKLSIPTPLPPSQSTPNLVSLRPDRTLSAPGRAQTTPPMLHDRPPSWDATWSDTLSPSPLISNNAASFDQATFPEQVDTPKIRLSSPTTTDDRALEDSVEQMPTPARRNSVAIDGLGLGLETITETSHSRENSLATPYIESPTDILSPSDTSRSITPSPIVASTSTSNSPLPSSSTNSLQSSFSSTLASRKATMRQSVVVYPTGKSLNFSSESLKKSTSVPPSPAINPPDSPAGLNFEERAREFAQRCWDEDETFLDTKKIAEWLGTTLVHLCCIFDGFLMYLCVVVDLTQRH